MKRIRLKESQAKLLKETFAPKKKKNVMKITESQYQSLTKSEPIDNNFDEISELEFFEGMMYFLEEMNTNKNPELPEILKNTGISPKKLKELLIGHGILKIVKNGNVNSIKVQGNGISKSLGKLFTDIKKQVQPEAKDETELTEDYPPGAEHDPNAPYNQPEEKQKPYGDIVVNRIIDFIDDFTILDTEKGFILAYDVYMGDNDLYDNQEREISNSLDNMTISTDANEFINGESNAVYLNNSTLGDLINEFSDDIPELAKALSKLSGNIIHEEESELLEEENKPLELIIFLQDHEANEGLNILAQNGPDSAVEYLSQWDNGDGGEETDYNSLGSSDKKYETENYLMVYNTSYGYIGLYKKMSNLDEMTTTGDVGGSFETPSAWSKNPKKNIHSDKSTIEGGKIIKPGIGDKMSTIRENLIKSLPKIYTVTDGKINEDITFKKGDGVIYMVSDAADPKVRKNETFKSKDYAKEYGFKWDKVKSVWYTDSSNIEQVKKLAEVIEICKDTFSHIDEIPEMIEELRSNEAEEQKIATKEGIKIKTAKEIEELFQKFYEGLDADLDSNEYANVTSEYIKFIVGFRNKFNKSYSPRNMLLIFIQMPTATVVGNANDWKKVKRKMKAGTKGLRILTPKMRNYQIKRKKEEKINETVDNTKTDKENDEYEYVDVSYPEYYYTTAVFDVSQTERWDGKEDPVDTGHSWQPSNEPNERAEELAGVLIDVIKEDGIKVTSNQSRGGEDGFSAGDWINISSGSAGERLLSSLIHEYAHELLHWKKSKFTVDDIEIDNATQEIQAEGIAIGIMNHYGFDVTPGKIYLKSWRTKGKEGIVTVKSNIEVMMRCTGYIVQKMSERLEAKHNGSENRIVSPK